MVATRFHSGQGTFNIQYFFTIDFIGQCEVLLICQPQVIDSWFMMITTPKTSYYNNNNNNNVVEMFEKLDSGKTTNNTAMIRDIYTKKKESPLEVQQLAVWLEGGPAIIVRSFNGYRFHFSY